VATRRSADRSVLASSEPAGRVPHGTLPARGLALSAVEAELLDDPAADPAAVALSLGNIARANRWFGGRWAVTWALARALRGLPRGTRVTLLDVGTGMGDLPCAARAWGRRRGLDVMPLGLERSRVAAALARDAGVRTVVGCAGALPFRAGSVDVVLVSQVVHHLSPESTVRLLQALDRTARRAVLVADLRRSTLARLAFRVGAALLRFDHNTRHDGLVSIRRGYTLEELRALMRAAGVPARLAARPFWRVVALWRPTATDAGERTATSGAAPDDVARRAGATSPGVAGARRGRRGA
jgi:SAM-dependent methyltransferase